MFDLISTVAKIRQLCKTEKNPTKNSVRGVEKDINIPVNRFFTTSLLFCC